MDLSEYQTITGITVPSSDTTRVTATISRVQRMLEDMLGYTLDTDEINTNHYSELGKTANECPCPSNVDLTALEDADAVVTAYRLFPYSKSDQYMVIDPATDINAVKLVFENVTYKTLETYEYREDTKRGLIKYLEQTRCWCSLTCNCHTCDQVQLAVDADWKTDIADDLKDVWAEMVTYYSSLKTDIKRETMGPHTYEKFSNTPPQKKEEYLSILNFYAGPNGSLFKVITI